MLAFAVARRWANVRSNAVEPGWVATKMGGPEATDDLSEGALTQAWLAAGNDSATDVSGRYFFHKQELQAKPVAADIVQQDAFLAYCEQISEIALP